MVESVVIMCEHSPIGKNSAAEAIRIGSGFVALGEFVDCKIIFWGDAIYFLNKNADPVAIGMDPSTETIEMAELSDLELYILDSALNEAGLTLDDLIDYENLNVINMDKLIELMDVAEVVLRI